MTSFAVFRRGILPAVALAGLLAATGASAQDEPLTDKEGNPTYKVEEGKVDRGTFNGFRRYHNSCHVCHGPDGMGGSFAPNLTESLKKLDYMAFADVVTNGRSVQGGGSGERVMPSFGLDPNVMEHMDDIYRYLKARSDEKVGRGRPERIGG